MSVETKRLSVSVITFLACIILVLGNPLAAIALFLYCVIEQLDLLVDYYYEADD